MMNDDELYLDRFFLKMITDLKYPFQIKKFDSLFYSIHNKLFLYTLREETFASGKLAKFLELTFANDLF